MAQQSGPSFVPSVSMYDAQAQNRWRTVVLITIFTVIVVALAFIFGDILGGSSTAGVALVPLRARGGHRARALARRQPRYPGDAAGDGARRDGRPAVRLAHALGVLGWPLTRP